MVIRALLLKKVTWPVGSSPPCSQYTCGWTRAWAPPKKILDPPMPRHFFTLQSRHYAEQKKFHQRLLL